MSLEELILRHALGQSVDAIARGERASGAMMIPIPAAGVLLCGRRARGGAAVPGIEEVTISAHVGQRLVPLPEGSRYLGFVFARADSPARAEAALREAHGLLEFRIVGSEPMALDL